MHSLAIAELNHFSMEQNVYGWIQSLFVPA